MKLRKALVVLVLPAAFMVQPIAAAAEPVTAVSVPITDPYVAAAVIAGAVFQKNIEKNAAAAKDERGEGAKALKAATGVSEKDIKKHGVFGGRNSVFRKPFG